MTAKRYGIFGAGMMGRAIAYDLLASDPTCLVRLVDSTTGNLAAAAYGWPAHRTQLVQCDLSKVSETDLCLLAEGHDVLIGSARYDFNLRLSQTAINVGAHSIDLGGHKDTVEAQFKLHDSALNGGVALLPDCGIAPGAVSVLARYAIDRVPDVQKVIIRVGGLPQEPKPPFEYALAFSAHGLVANYAEPCEALVDGKRVLLPPLENPEYQTFPGLGRLTAANTSDGLATLCKTYEGIIPTLNYKTLRYHGHWEKMRPLLDAGLFADTPELVVNGAKMTPRDFMAAYFNSVLEHGVPDYLVLRVAALNAKGNGVCLDMVDKMDARLGHSAMQRTTGYSASICAQMLANGEIRDIGALKHEVHVPPQRFIDEWTKRGLVLTEHSRVP